MQKVRWTAMILVLLIAGLAIGIELRGEAPSPQYFRNPRQEYEEPFEIHGQGVNDETPGERSAAAERTADRIEEEFSRVQRAEIVMQNKRALVGLWLVETPDLGAIGPERMGGLESVKEHVRDLVLARHDDLVEVFVTTDRERYDRIAAISRDLSRGRPISDFASEIRKLLIETDREGREPSAE